MENKEQVTVTQSHIKEIYTEHRGRKERGTEGRKEERKEGRREGRSSREMSLGFLDLREAGDVL